MTDINLYAIDLNLLVVLDAVLEERSATRAAARLHVTQSSVSSSLRRARALFGDPLLVRTPYGFTPSARGAALAPRLQALLAGARELLAPHPAADALSRRSFTLACTDAISVTVVPAVLRELGARVPHASLRVVTLEHAFAEGRLASGEVDLVIGIPPMVPAGCSSELVYDDAMVAVVRRDHPSVGARLSLDQYASLPHVEVAVMGSTDDRVDRALARHGRTRSIRLSVPHFASIPFAIASSDCVASVSRRLAEAYEKDFPIRLLTAPVELPRLRVKQIWHRRSEADPGVQLLRQLVKRAPARRGRRLER